MDGVPDTTMCDIKNAIWHGLEAIPSNELALSWVVENLQPRSEATHCRAL